MLMQRYLLAVCLILVSAGLLPGQIVVRGKVVDHETREPLTGATVRGMGSGEGTYSDGFGNFSLRTFAEELRVSFIGYKQSTITEFSDGDDLLIEMVPLDAELPTAVVSDQISPIRLRVPAPLMEIPTRALQRDDGLAITPALNRVSGVYMQSGTLGTNRITLRGVGNRSPFATAKIRAFLDDIPLTNGVGETTIEDIDLSIIKDVQVWKGPTASIYGAALGGLIHLRTNKDLRREDSRFSVSGTLGSFGLARAVADLHYISPDRDANLYLNYNRTHSDGWRANSTYDREALTAYGSIRSGERDETSFLASLTDVTSFIPSSLNREDYEENPEIAAPNWAAISGFEDYRKVLVGLTHRHDLVRKKYGKTLSNISSLFASQRSNYEPRPFNILREESIATGFRTAFEYRNTYKRERPNLVLGAEFFNERYTWQTNEITDSGELDTLLSDNLERRTYYNIFAEANYDLTSKVYLSAGLNFNNTRYRFTDRYPNDGVDLSARRDFDPVLSPRLGIGFQPLSRVSFFASVSHGFSPPTLEETLNPEGSINPDINPEKGWNYELGFRSNALFPWLAFEVTWYQMHIKDLLVARRTAEDQYVGVNAGKTRHTGLEAYLQLDLLDNVRLWSSYTRAWYTFRDFVDGENDYSGNALTGQPPHLLSAGLDLQTGFGLFGFLTYQFVDAYPLNDANTAYNAAYHLLNLKLGYRQDIGKRFALELGAGVQNITDTHYASMTQINAQGFGGALPRYFYPGLPRNYYGMLKVEYRLTR